MKNKNLILPKPSGRKKSSDQYVPFDGAKLENICKKKSLSMTRLSIVLCDRSSNFLSTAIRRGTIDKEALQALCDGLGVDIDELLTKPEKPEPVEAQAEKADDTVVVAIQVLYDEQKKTNDILQQLLVEIKGVNAKSGRIEGRMSTIENAVGQLHTNVLKSNETLDYIYKEAKEVKSSVATVNGRVKDILNAKDSEPKIKAVK
jgi:uncharacterized coiled-coil DUF342 family protein